MSQFQSQSLVWLITGCSPGGFGEEFVRQIIARGDHAIATARDVAKIQHLKDNGVSILQLDLTDDPSHIHERINQAVNVHGKIDVLVNNASFIQTGVIEELTNGELERQFATNVFGTMNVTRALLPHLRARHSGTVLFISSLSGWIGHPGCGAYAASKFALEGLAESFHAETELLGIRSLLIEPGRFRTNFLSPSNLQATAPIIADYKSLSTALASSLANEDRKQPGDPQKLVRIVLDLIHREGIAADVQVPFRLPLGSDCYDEIKAKCEQTLATLENWQHVIRSTDSGNQ